MNLTPTWVAGRRGKWAVVAIWLLIAVAGSMYAGRVGDVETNDMRNWLPANAESTRALDVADAEFAGEDSERLLILYVRDAGITESDRAEVEADAARLPAIVGATVTPPIPSEDGRALLVTVPISADQAEEGVVEGIVEGVRAAVGGQPAGLDAWLTGGPAFNADFDAAFDSLDATLLLVTVAVVAVILLVTYRSPVLLVLPLVAVGVASQLANALVYLCGRHLGLVVDGASASILTVLLFGAGTDYALLLVSRYREELGRTADRHEAMRSAIARSFPAIAASAFTVILALLALVFADLNSTRGLGPVAALGIFSVFVAMSTLLPALLVICGRWAFWPVAPKVGGSTDAHRIWGRLAEAVARRHRTVWIATALGLAALTSATALLSTDLRRADSFVDTPESVQGGELLARHYAAGGSDPAEVYVRTARVEAVAAAARIDGVAEVGEPSSGGAWSRFDVVLADDPESPAAEATIVRLREAVKRVDAGALVGGATAQQLDQETTMDRDLRLVLPLILLVVFAVLVVLLRALVAPLLLLGSVVLSFGAALGAAALVFRAIGFPAIDRSLLLNGFLFLVALGVDYTIFLMTRAREEVAVLGHRRGVPRALAVTGGVITSAGVVLAATFSVLTLMPIVFMMQLGVVVALGVLLDTFVVRSLLVPALVLDAGERSWWPSRLQAARQPGDDQLEEAGRPVSVYG